MLGEPNNPLINDLAIGNTKDAEYAVYLLNEYLAKGEQQKANHLFLALLAESVNLNSTKGQIENQKHLGEYLANLIEFNFHNIDFPGL